jgi:glycosyltransferase involved in cell wall biosynthesis
MQFKVSVIIPVYKAEKYIRNAVKSAVFLEEVGEIILIEDGSPDNALAECYSLQKEFEKVKVIRHPNGENRGAGASRNLGIKSANFNYIAFLDADDAYLPNRFAITKAVFAQAADVTGVYEAIGVNFYDEKGKELFCKIRNISREQADSYDTRLKVDDSGSVYKYLITGSRGFFNTSGVTIRRDVFKDSFYFDESLRLHQDTELWIRLSYHYRFEEGSKEPVSLRGVHADNRISGQNLVSKNKYYQALLRYFRKQNVPYSIKFYLYKAIIRNHPKRRYIHSGNQILKIGELLVLSVREVRKFPLL